MKDVVRYQAEDGAIFATREAAEMRDRSDELRDALLVAAGIRPIGHRPRPIGGARCEIFERVADEIAEHDPHLAGRTAKAVAALTAESS